MFFNRSVNGFVDPQGELHIFPQLVHEQFAEELAKEYNMDLDECESYCDLLQKCGWVQLTMSCLVFDVFELGLRLNRRQRGAILDVWKELSPQQQSTFMKLTR